MKNGETPSPYNCPFCGSTRITPMEDGDHAWVSCLGCGATGPTAADAAMALRRWNWCEQAPLNETTGE